MYATLTQPKWHWLALSFFWIGSSIVMRRTSAGVSMIRVFLVAVARSGAASDGDLLLATPMVGLGSTTDGTVSP